MVRCTLPWVQLKVEPGDQVRVCCWAKASLGTLDEFPTLESAWNGPAIRAFRRAMLEGNHESVCSEVCPYLMNGTHTLDKFQIPPDDAGLARRTIREEIEAGSETVSVPPLRMEASLDDRCALKCVMCTWNTGKYRIHPNFYVFVNDAEASLEELELLGGEPFYSKQVLDILKHARLHRPAYKFAFTTSLSHLPLSLLQHVRIAWMIVSIDGATKPTYEAIRVGANWEAVLVNLGKLLDFRNKANEWFHIQVNYTVMTRNFPEIPRAIRLFNDLGVPVAFYKVNLVPHDARDVFQRQDLRDVFQKTMEEGLTLSRYKETRASLEALLAVLKDFRETYDSLPA